MARVVQRHLIPRPQHVDAVKLASAVSALAGLYMLMSAWVRDIGAGNQLNAIIAGSAAVILATSRYIRMAGPWASWGGALIGSWFAISPWVYGYAGHRWMWHSMFAGLLMIVMNLWSASSLDG